MNKKIFIEKIEMLKNNPKVLFHWGYKIINLLKRNALNNGERYDPNIMRKFNMNDLDQETRYRFAQTSISESDIVLDIACGTGYGSLMLAEKCRQVIGVDISKEGIEYANRHYKTSSNIEFIQTDIFKFNDLADVVISFETIEHINGRIEDVVSKLISLAKKKLICSVPYKESPGSNQHHVHFNIDERTFNFISSKYKVSFLYQSKDGKIHKSKRSDILALIIIIDKKSNSRFNII